ncbi:hypothetical protein SHI21_00255 [Bacteriovorax sp. PP10]|uniref:Prepilin-type N-terminal cleavage/methylation domain-containing protein n=1 Tax=Bacteriovorax antarcticus TaxID=3088717 RepID=A0ABU5VNJ6_9BACT|nr:hypothetical protein [Bacteriovorax sp. PP10]MEA9354613.1 hypothetical protein [Bacteriovorax sp. PP10]
MAKLQNPVLLRNKKGQSVVEYILLLVVITSIGYSFYNNRAFKNFIKGDVGLFANLRKRMEYSYRYGREMDANVDHDQAMSFQYQSNRHDTYFNAKTGQSHFFSGLEPYGE